MENVIEFVVARGAEGGGKSRLFRPAQKLVEGLFESRSYALSRLHAEMKSDLSRNAAVWYRSVRPFRQRFCKFVREQSGISAEELCTRLNEHPDILKLRSLPGSYRFYPITRELLISLESAIEKILEYNPYGGGFLALGVMGVPRQPPYSVQLDRDD